MPKKIQDEVMITEISEFEPSRVDGVGKGANGFPILMLKQLADDAEDTHDRLDVVSTEIIKEDDASRPKCKLCDGDGKIRGDKVKCPKCFGTGFAPRIGESTKSFLQDAAKEAGVAPSTAPAELTEGDCPTCNGSGTIADNTHDGKMCVDCGGTGIDQTMTNEKELSEANADPGRISIGDPEGREKMDKGHHDFDPSGFRPAPYKPDADEVVTCPKCELMNDLDSVYCDQCGHQLAGDDDVMVDGVSLDPDDDTQKAKADPNVGGGRVRENIADEDFAGKDRSFPIVTAGDVSDAASSLGRAGADNFPTDKIKANIIAIAKRKGQSFVDELPQKWQDEMAEKAMDSMMTSDGAVFSAPNPALSDAEPDDGDAYPGSPEWESVDAQTATDAAHALMEAADYIRRFAQRETIEVAAGEGNDVFDAKAAEMALSGVTEALGIMTQLAFHESAEAEKSIEFSEDSLSAIKAAQVTLDKMLGNTPAKQNTSKGDTPVAANIMESVDEALLSKEIEDMSTEELEKVLDARDERLVEMLAGVLKGEVSEEEAPSVDTAEVTKRSKKSDDKEAKMANDDVACKGCGEMCKADDINCMKCGMVMKAELTEEEIEAKLARKEAKKALKAAEKAEKEAAENAAVQKAIAEGVAEATAAVTALQERLSTVEKMAAPTTIVRTRPTDAFIKSAERDELDMRIAQLERVARETPDQDIRKAAREEAKELRDRAAAISA
jgi:hypothetical protein